MPAYAQLRQRTEMRKARLQGMSVGSIVLQASCRGTEKNDIGWTGKHIIFEKPPLLPDTLIAK